MKHLDLFSGIGGFALAASRTWGEQYENVGHCEIEEYACKVYHKHFPDSKCLGDITKVKWNEGQADIITGGFPCQPHSQAGKRLASKDERDLWYECKRAVSEIRPRYALFENVAGLLTSERGGFFNRVLSDLAEIGYNAEWHIISASSVGAPHQRKRVWIISYPHSNKNGLQGWNNSYEDKGKQKRNFKRVDSPNGWRQKNLLPQPVFCRSLNGLSFGVDRISALGNAIVPQVAQLIMEAIKEDDESKQ